MSIHDVEIRRYNDDDGRNNYVEVEIEESWTENYDNEKAWRSLNVAFTPGSETVDFRAWRSAGEDIDGYSRTEEVNMDLNRESAEALRDILNRFLDQ